MTYLLGHYYNRALSNNLSWLGIVRRNVSRQKQ